MVMKIDYVQFDRWAGYRVRGTEPVVWEAKTPDWHINRVFHLVAQLEAPKWGSVQSYDGVAMSGGPLHNIAVHRTGHQGSLWGLLRRVATDGQARGAFAALEERLAVRGWFVAPDQQLRRWDTKVLVPGREIVEEFTGPRGVAARRGPAAIRAQEWVEAFHVLFANRATWPAQTAYAIDWLLEGQELLEDAAYRKYAGVTSRDAACLSMEKLKPELDLAMCVYHAHSVNAPGKAAQILSRCLTTDDSSAFAARLIRSLGTAKFARWADTPDNRNRYDRTRLAVEKSRLWPKDVVKALLPKDF